MGIYNQHQMAVSESTSDYKLEIVVNPPPVRNGSTKNDSRDFFTQGDVISGSVRLQVLKDITVKDIQVSIMGKSWTQITKMIEHEFMPGQFRNDTDKMVHDLLYDVVTVFPPTNVKEVTDNRKFTLTPNIHDYDFSFPVPKWSHCGDEETRMQSNAFVSPYESVDAARELNNRKNRHIKGKLPPAFEITTMNCKGDIAYNLRVVIHKCGFLSTDIQLLHPLNIRPLGMTTDKYNLIHAQTGLSPVKKKKMKTEDPTTDPKKSRLKSLFTHNGSYVAMRLQLVLKAYIVANVSPFEMELHTSIKHPLFVRSVEISLIQMIKLATYKYSDYSESVIPVLKLSEPRAVEFTPYKEPNGEFTQMMDLSQLIRGINWDKVVPQSFTTCNMEVGYKVRATVHVSAKSQSWWSNGEALRVMQDVVVGNIDDEDEEETPEQLPRYEE